MKNTFIEAEYEDGFILNQIKNSDTSIFSKKGNTFTDILNFLPIRYHGRMVRFSLYHNNKRHDINWNMTPLGSRPFFMKTMSSSLGNIYIGSSGIIQNVEFGYEYMDINGQLIRETIKL
jgi:hypothetical protein